MGEAEDRWLDRNSLDHVRQAVKAAIALLPVAGGAGAELFEWIVPAALEARRAAWIAELDRRLGEVEAIVCDELFVTFVVEASKAALSTHLESKVKLLADSVATAAATNTEDGFMAMRHLRHVADLDPEHFLVLAALRAGVSASREQVDKGAALSPGIIVEGVGRTEAILAFFDLEAAGLAYRAVDDPRRGSAGPKVSLSRPAFSGGRFHPSITDEGAELLRFVRILAE